jgi:hypothetical protein
VSPESKFRSKFAFGFAFAARGAPEITAASVTLPAISIKSRRRLLTAIGARVD